MLRAMYALLTINPFCTPNNPGPVADYTHYYHSMKNIERACFNAVDTSINDAFKVSNNPTIIGWHRGMTVQEILDQLSTIYSQPTPAAMELNDDAFRSHYSAANALEVLFR
jgi:hypothetical protein